jgi:hypothetical protein
MIGEKAASIIKRDYEEYKENRHKPQTFISSTKTTEVKNLDPLTLGIYDQTESRSAAGPSVVQLENTRPIDPVTSDLNTASEKDLLSMFEQLVLDPVSDPQPFSGTEAGSLGGVDLKASTGILDKSGRLTEDALLHLVGAASEPTKTPAGGLMASSSTQKEVQSLNHPSKPLDIAKAARNTVKQAKDTQTVDVSLSDIFSDIQNLSLDLPSTMKNKKQPILPIPNTLSIERTLIPARTRKPSQTSNAGATRQQSIPKEKSTKKDSRATHRVIDMHSLMNEQSAPNSAKRVIDMHSFFKSQMSATTESKKSNSPESFTLDGVLKATSEIIRGQALNPLSDSLQSSRVSSVGTETIFDNHREMFPSREPDVLGFSSGAGSLQ